MRYSAILRLNCISLSMELYLIPLAYNSPDPNLKKLQNKTPQAGQAAALTVVSRISVRHLARESRRTIRLYLNCASILARASLAADAYGAILIVVLAIKLVNIICGSYAGDRLIK